MLESDQAEQDLRRMILTLELAPGSVVSQPVLSERLRCGRTPLREALQRLSNEGLLTLLPHKRGIAIAGLGVVDFGVLVEALDAVEARSARLAAERISAADLDRLDTLITQAIKASKRGDYGALALIDYEFHRIIAEATGNPHIATMMCRLHLHSARFGCLAWRIEGSAEQSWEDHRRIVAALRSRDGDKAESELRDHTERWIQRMLVVLRTGHGSRSLTPSVAG